MITQNNAFLFCNLSANSRVCNKNCLTTTVSQRGTLLTELPSRNTTMESPLMNGMHVFPTNSLVPAVLMIKKSINAPAHAVNDSNTLRWSIRTAKTYLPIRKEKERNLLNMSLCSSRFRLLG